MEKTLPRQTSGHRQCPKCGGEPYMAPSMLRRHDYQCYECLKAQCRQWRQTSKGKAYTRDYNREWARQNQDKIKARPSYQTKTAWTQAYRAANPEKYKARTAVGNALQSGKLVREPCVICGTTQRVQAHHDDYSKPLEVRWMCAPCHNTYHRLTDNSTILL